MSETNWSEFEQEHRALIAVAEANLRDESYSWHVFDWMAWKLRYKYPLIMKDTIIGNISS